MKMGSDCLNKNFCDHLLWRVQQTDSLKLVLLTRFSTLGIKTEEVLFSLGGHFCRKILWIKSTKSSSVSHNFFKQKPWKPSRLERFVQPNREDCRLYLTKRRNLSTEDQVLGGKGFLDFTIVSSKDIREEIKDMWFNLLLRVQLLTRIILEKRILLSSFREL